MRPNTFSQVDSKIRKRVFGLFQNCNTSALCRPLLTGGLVLGLGGLSGCSALDVSNPTVIEGESLDNSTGAENLWTVARQRLVDAVGRGALHSGLLTDEFFADVPADNVFENSLLDRREGVLYETQLNGNVLAGNDGSAYTAWQRVMKNVSVAMYRVRAYTPAGVKEARLGELLPYGASPSLA